LFSRKLVERWRKWGGVPGIQGVVKPSLTKKKKTIDEKKKKNRIKSKERQKKFACANWGKNTTEPCPGKRKRYK